MTLTRKDLRVAMEEAALAQSGQQNLAVAVPAPQETPSNARPVTQATPDGPTYVGSTPTAPYGEDPTDPTTQAQPRVQASGMVGQLNLPPPPPQPPPIPFPPRRRGWRGRA